MSANMRRELILAMSEVYSGGPVEGNAIVEAVLRVFAATADRRVADMREAAARCAEERADKLLVPIRAFRGKADVSRLQEQEKAHREYASAIRKLPLPDAPEPQGWRHKKRGTVYREVGHATLQASVRYPKEGDVLVVYRGEDGRLWAREYGEFHDGRFERLTPPSARTAQDDGATP